MHACSTVLQLNKLHFVYDGVFSSRQPLHPFRAGKSLVKPRTSSSFWHSTAAGTASEFQSEVGGCQIR